MKWLIGLVIFAVIAVVGDAAVRSYAESRIEARLASELKTDTTDVSLGGFPFVVRLAGGRIPSVSLDATGARRAGLQIARLHLDLKGVRMSFDSTATAGSASAAVERGTGSAEIELDVLGDYIERQTPLKVIRFDGDQVVVSFRGRRSSVPIRLESGSIVLRARSMDDVDVPLPRVLEGIEYGTLEVKDNSALLTFELNNATLRSI